ncbi:MFS transporter [uncultured Aquitalea sp.]|nr:MFS transporter [uncultured Aquitalea sp.]
MPSPSSASYGDRSAVAAGSVAHAVHDGLTDLVYVLLPVWQQQFLLPYAVVGLLRGAYSGAMASCQLTMSRLALRFGRRRLLLAGTVLTGCAYLLASQALGLYTLLLALVLGGLGASTQHPLASALVADSQRDETRMRQALAHYNFAGDVGKMALPALTGIGLAYVGWRYSLLGAGALGLAAAGLLAWLLPKDAAPTAQGAKRSAKEAGGAHGGLTPLLLTGFLDTAARSGFMTFLPFLLQAHGAGKAAIGLALSLLFVGGAFGKLACGYLGARIGMMRTVWLSETATSLMIALALIVPLWALWLLLPPLGLVLNGTSTALAGTVPAVSGKESRERGFARFYTVTIGAGAIAPVLFGALSDRVGLTDALLTLAAVLLLTLPLSWKVEQALTNPGA